MKKYNEVQIRKRISMLNDLLDKDEKDGLLSVQKFNQYWQELHQLEHDLLLIYILRYLKRKINIVDLDLSLLPFSDDGSDSDMEECKTHIEAYISHSHKKYESLQR